MQGIGIMVENDVQMTDDKLSFGHAYRIRLGGDAHLVAAPHEIVAEKAYPRGGNGQSACGALILRGYAGKGVQDVRHAARGFQVRRNLPGVGRCADDEGDPACILPHAESLVHEYQRIAFPALLERGRFQDRLGAELLRQGEWREALARHARHDLVAPLSAHPILQGVSMHSNVRCKNYHVRMLLSIETRQNFANKKAAPDGAASGRYGISGRPITKDRKRFRSG